MTKRLFVLGATGHIGEHVVDLALARGHQVTAFVRSPRKLARNGPGLSVIEGDPLSTDALARALPTHDAVLSSIGPSPRGRGPEALAAFEACRRELVLLAYRMLGDMARAEDMVQEAWLRWGRRAEDPTSPRAYLITVVTRLCLNELDSARARREESRADRLPEPVAIDETSLERLESLDQVSMGLLLVLQRLNPAERAVLLLHDVFDFDHAAIGALIGKSAPSCRKLLERARRSVAEERRTMAASQDEHRRLLRAFLAAANAGDPRTLVELLADDAIMISDGGVDGVATGGFRNLPRPLHGSARIAAFVAAATHRNAGFLRAEERHLNGRPAVVFFRGEEPFAALLLAVADGKIRRVFFHADRSRLRYLGE